MSIWWPNFPYCGISHFRTHPLAILPTRLSSFSHFSTISINTPVRCLFLDIYRNFSVIIRWNYYTKLSNLMFVFQLKKNGRRTKITIFHYSFKRYVMSMAVNTCHNWVRSRRWLFRAIGYTDVGRTHIFRLILGYLSASSIYTCSRYVVPWHSLTLTLSVTILSREIERTPGKTVGISYGNQTHFKYFPAQGFQVFCCEGMLRECVG